MNQSTDQQLLREYAERRSEAAFAELVRRHVDLVNSVALRMVGDAHLAGDVTQAVFLALAKNARHLLNRRTVEGWLHSTARNLAANTVRAEVRRRNREKEASLMNEILAHGAEVNWEHLSPNLDEALGELSEPERDALLLRYFKNQDFRTVGASLGISDDAAQKRVSRAVEQLRVFFAKRGVTVGATGLVVFLSSSAVQAAPAGLAATISAAVALAESAVHTSTLIAATKTIAMTTLQKALVTATVSVLAVAGIYEARLAGQLSAQNQRMLRQQGPMAEEIRQLQSERDDATSRLTGLQDQLAKSQSDHLELLRLRSAVTKLRQDSQEQARDSSQPKTDNEFLSLALAEAREEITNSITKRLASLKTNIGLTPEQEKQINSILQGDIEPLSQIQMSAITGYPSRAEVLSQEKNLRTGEDAQIAAILTAGQQTAYQEFKREKTASASLNYAKSEASAMSSYLELSPGQSQAVVDILASLPAGQGGQGNAQDPDAKEQLEFRLQALSQTLTPEQIDKYRAQKLATIQQAAIGIQMIKSLAK